MTQAMVVTAFGRLSGIRAAREVLPEDAIVGAMFWGGLLGERGLNGSRVYAPRGERRPAHGDFLLRCKVRTCLWPVAAPA